VSPASVIDVAMSSTSRGVGIAVAVERGISIGHPYLVRTGDGGRSWVVDGALRGSPATQFDAPSVLAANNRDLYAIAFTAPRLQMSTDGGARWLALRVRGEFQDAAVVGAYLWVTADRCRLTSRAPRTSTCRSYLYRYPVGRSRNTPGTLVPHSTSIGVESPSALAPHWMAASVFAVEGPDGAVLADTAGQPGRSALVATSDGGATWRNVWDPCETSIPMDLFTPSPSRWLLYCSLGGGMNQGLNQLFVSSDQGRAWRLLAAANDEHYVVGRFDDAMSSSLAQSGDARHLWQLATVGWMLESTDGGAVWFDPPRPSPNVEFPGRLDAVGARAAFLPAIGQGLWRTFDGVHWSLVR
jgi:hypothetical protein